MQSGDQVKQGCFHESGLGEETIAQRSFGRAGYGAYILRGLLALACSAAFDFANAQAANAQAGTPQTQALAPLHSSEASTLLVAPANTCSLNREMTIEEFDMVQRFRSRLSYLEKDVNENHVDLEQHRLHMQDIASTGFAQPAVAKSAELQSQFMTALLEEELRVMANRTGLIRSKLYQDLKMELFSIHHGGFAGLGKLKSLIARMKSHLRESFAAGRFISGPATEGSRAANSAFFPSAEHIDELIETLHSSLLHEAGRNERASARVLNNFSESVGMAINTGAFVGSLVASAPVIAAGATYGGTPGIIMAGCAIGGLGGGSAAALQQYYENVTRAWLRAENNKTSFACEFEEESEHHHVGEQFYEGLSQGVVSGCLFVGGSMVLPKTTVYSLTAAVVLATGLEAGAAGLRLNDAYKTYQTYLALASMQKAEDLLASGNEAEATEVLKTAQMQAQNAGAHLLNSVLTGILLKGLRGEIHEAFELGKVHIASLVAKSSDNAAVAIQLLTDSVQRELQPVKH